MSDVEVSFEVRKLRREDNVAKLSLGHENFAPLKSFLRKDAKAFERDSLARTYAAFIEGAGEVIAYVTIICGEIVIEDEKQLEHPEDVNFRYSHYPALKIARLATDRRFRGYGLGQSLVELSLGIAHEFICPNVGCRFIVVDAKKESVGFYEKCGFTIIDTEANLQREEPVMFIDLHRVRQNMAD